MSVATAPHALVIEGGNPLSGRIRASGNKNGALPILAACLLADEPVTLSNVPRIRDVETMLEIICGTGASADWTAPNEVQVDPRGLSSHEVDPVLAERIRASFLLAGPLLARLGRASVPPPGGDVIGRRRLDPHIHALERLGARIQVESRYEMQTDGLRGAQIFLDEASVMATENAIMAAVVAPGETTIGNAACEPHVQDLCRFLVSLGARITGIESNVLRVHGVERLTGGEWTIASEHIEVGSFIGLAAVTSSDLTIDGVVPNDMASILTAFSRLGIEVELGDDWLRVPPHQKLVIQNDLGDQVPKIEDGPWPAFPADLTSIAVAVATQAWGTVLVFEKMFENRLFFVDKLVSMGARIIVCDPHRVVVSGPSRLYGQRLTSPDIRAGMAMLIAALCANGRSVIGNVAEIDRGYERIDDRLRAVGAQIERVEAYPAPRPLPSAEMSEQAAAGVRVNVYGHGEATVGTGLPVLNQLLSRLAETARFDLVLDIEPGDTQAEVEAAAAAVGHALAGPLRTEGARGHGAGVMTSAEALASVVLEASDEPLFVTNVDLTQARIGGLGTDVARRFLEVLAESAGLVLHVRLLNGTDSGHVLEAIFKALGAALAEACEREEARP